MVLTASGISKQLSDIFPRTRETKEKINKWDYIKTKRFCTAKETINKIKRGAHGVGELIFQ